MYEYIIGKYISLNKEYIIVENNGFGYKIFTSGNTISQLPEANKDVKLFLQQIVREDFIGLYGFLEEEEREMFNKLLSINGVGAKAALSLLSISNVRNLKLSIIGSDEKTLTRAPGIGKKTAQRIILEMKDKIEDIAYEDEDIPSEAGIQGKIHSVKSLEATEALISLGFNQKEAEKTLKEIDINLQLEEIIKIALKQLIQM
ncbi:Holliday junction branch migration protein RuvA [Clostridium sediminicola]|uniref:Holliday junction branch migration protein RuvA n=1 Tax=Clostridium sediminicola TaxID=3114879 RepID=UPI0031F1F82B